MSTVAAARTAQSVLADELIVSADSHIHGAAPICGRKI
jgi:hypothetical protein